MLITVIITAYNRREFILYAVNSVLNQTLKDNYELIVIKNYHDKIIDSFLEENKIKHIYSEEKTLGGKLSEAIKSSSGEIIAFLEDDDAFMKCKLEYLFSLFKKHKNLIYYHNCYIPVNEKRSITVYDKHSPDFNMSCITISKEIINIGKIPRVNDLLDTFMYLSALESGKLIMVNRKKLTYYMVHQSASNIFATNLMSFTQARIKYLNNLILTLNQFNNFFKGRRSKNYLKSQIGYYELHRFIYTKQYIPKNLINFLIYSKIGFMNRIKYTFIYMLLRLFRNKYRNYIENRIYKKWIRKI